MRFLLMEGSFAASISSMASPEAFGSAPAGPWSAEDKPPALVCEACEACEAAVDPALTSLDIVANVARVCEHNLACREIVCITPRISPIF